MKKSKILISAVTMFAYPFEGTINSVGVYQDVISDDELVQLTGQQCM